MYNKSNVTLTIDYQYYEKLINNVILLAPIEAGVEILAFMLLESFVSQKDYTLIDINRFSKENAKKFGVKNNGDGAVPDFVVVKKEYNYQKKSDDDICLGYVEIKKPSDKINTKSGQAKAHIAANDHVLFTNGIVWKYINKKDVSQSWEILLDIQEKQSIKNKPFSIDEMKFSELLIRLNKIRWGE